MKKLISHDYAATRDGEPADGPLGVTTHTAVLTGSGALTAGLVHEGTNDLGPSPVWIPIVTFTMSGNDSVSEVATLTHAFARYRSRCTGLTGTNALLKSAMNGMGAR